MARHSTRPIARTWTRRNPPPRRRHLHHHRGLPRPRKCAFSDRDDRRPASRSLRMSRVRSRPSRRTRSLPEPRTPNRSNGRIRRRRKSPSSRPRPQPSNRRKWARSRRPRSSPRFDGLGEGFEGPQGTATYRNPSDNSIAVGPDHIVQTVNSRMAVFTKKGKRFAETGTDPLRPRPDQQHLQGLRRRGADQQRRRRGPLRPAGRPLARRHAHLPPPAAQGERPAAAQDGRPRASQPVRGRRPARPRSPPLPASPADARGESRGRRGPRRRPGPARAKGRSRSRPEAAGQAPAAARPGLLRHVLRRQHEPRSAGLLLSLRVPPGRSSPTIRGPRSGRTDITFPRARATMSSRSTPTSPTGPEMLKGEPATEQGVIIDGVNFLNNADLDGKELPPPGAPNIMMAAGGTQLKKIFEDDGIFAWTFHVDWNDPSKTQSGRPGQDPRRALPLSRRRAVVLGRSPAGDRAPPRLPGRQDHVSARLSPDRKTGVHRRRPFDRDVGRRRRRALVRVPPRRRQSRRQAPSAGHVRSRRLLPLDGQPGHGRARATSASDILSAGRRTSPASASPAGSRTIRPGKLTLREVVLAEGEASQTNTLRWMDYAQTAMDPDDDMTIWYVGDYLKKGATNYSTRIGAFRLATD